PLAFFAGFASFIAPCVLPLVPGYLATIGGRVSPRRAVITSVPFVAGFTGVFVALGISISALSGTISQRAFEEIAGFVLVVIGVVFGPAMGSFRWLRNHYRYIEVVGGVMLVVLGLLLFFGNLWWLRAGLADLF